MQSLIPSFKDDLTFQNYNQIIAKPYQGINFIFHEIELLDENCWMLNVKVHRVSNTLGT